jgi:hypothetical protein
MLTILWFVLAWVGGGAAILGSLMTVASFLLWLIPADPIPWKGRMAVLSVAVGLTIVGFVLLWVVPFPGND